MGVLAARRRDRQLRAQLACSARQVRAGEAVRAQLQREAAALRAQLHEALASRSQADALLVRLALPSPPKVHQIGL